MLNRFQNGTIVDFQAGEDLKNNDVYIVDPVTRKIRKPVSCDEWLTCQLVYVYNADIDRFYKDLYGDNIIKKDEFCRCWLSYLII